MRWSRQDGSGIPLPTFIEEHDGVVRALVFVNRSEPVQLRSMLEGTFERQPVRVEEATAETTVLQLDNEGELIAESLLSAVSESLLFTNSDTYITGTTSLKETELPDVLVGLEDVPFACVAPR